MIILFNQGKKTVPGKFRMGSRGIWVAMLTKQSIKSSNLMIKLRIYISSFPKHEHLKHRRSRPSAQLTRALDLEIARRNHLILREIHRDNLYLQTQKFDLWHDFPAIINLYSFLRNLFERKNKAILCRFLSIINITLKGKYFSIWITLI